MITSFVHLEKGEPMEIIIKCSDSCRGGTNLDGTPIKEIVRCGECKKVDTFMCPMFSAGWGYTDEDFCSEGERRADGDI